MDCGRREGQDGPERGDPVSLAVLAVAALVCFWRRMRVEAEQEAPPQGTGRGEQKRSKEGRENKRQSEASVLPGLDLNHQSHSTLTLTSLI